jgi:hypothetical protein
MPTFQATTIEPIEDLFQATRVKVVRTHPATTPIDADLITSSAGVSPGVAGVVAQSSTAIRVTFERAAVDNAALRNAGNYAITPSLTIVSVTPEIAVSPSYVDLEVSEQTTGVNYTVTLVRIEAV